MRKWKFSSETKCDSSPAWDHSDAWLLTGFLAMEAEVLDSLVNSV